MTNMFENMCYYDNFRIIMSKIKFIRSFFRKKLLENNDKFIELKYMKVVEFKYICIIFNALSNKRH